MARLSSLIRRAAAILPGGKSASAASRHVLQLGHPALRRRALPVKAENITGPACRDLVRLMVNVMREHEGTGLAAPQLGVALQVVVLEVTARHLDLESMGRDVVRCGMAEVPLRVLINPTVRADPSSGTATHREGCLSLLNYSAQVTRPRACTVTYTDEHGLAQKWRTEGWPARVIQHECDHLVGRIYTDIMLPDTFAYDPELFKHPPSAIDVTNDGAKHLG